MEGERGDATWLRQYNQTAHGKTPDHLLDFRKTGAVTVARIQVEELCHPQVPQRLRQELMRHFEKPDARQVVLDLSEVQYVASAVIGVLVWADTTLKARGGQLALAGVHWRLHELLELCGMGKLMPTFPRPEEAVENLNKP
jgi:anti-sigma B factor antagonist